MKRETVFKHISDIRAGDVVMHNDRQMTVGIMDIKRSDFMGVTLFGDSYQLGRQKVEVVLMDRAIPNVAGGQS